MGRIPREGGEAESVIQVENLLGPDELAQFSIRQLRPADPIVTPWPRLNQVCHGGAAGRGIPRGWFVVLGGMTGLGKSLVLANLLRKAWSDGRRCGIITLEMTADEQRGRLLPQIVNFPASNFERGQWNREAGKHSYWAVQEHAERHPNAAIFANTEIRRGLDYILEIMTHWRDDGVHFIAVDYLQLIAGGHGEKEIAANTLQIAAALRDFAQRNEILVVAASQFSAGVLRENRTCRIYDLYGGIALANDSSMVLLMDHLTYQRDKMTSTLARGWMTAQKVRHGISGECWPIQYDYQSMTLTQPEPPHGWPEPPKEWVTK